MNGPHDAASAAALIRLGVTLAQSGCDALALLTDDPVPGVFEVADCIDAAILAVSAELNSGRIFAGGDA